ncbi:hypothetical protein L5515_012521 [Caenorhabditis briggsae]|uniref:Uncharacterized protein n=1 Tax=Caenorhabditis briggsae TaxID=6238 RepID=A0AAE9EZN6_CAEBR|nr:hypothetical protein L5515_012521 [Caenorhabditis briggsae]
MQEVFDTSPVQMWTEMWKGMCILSIFLNILSVFCGLFKYKKVPKSTGWSIRSYEAPRSQNNQTGSHLFCDSHQVLQHFIVDHMDLKVEDKDERCSEDCFRKEEISITGFCERELIEKLMEYSTQPDGPLYTEEHQERPSGLQKSANQIPMSRQFHIAHARSTAKDDRAIGRDQSLFWNNDQGNVKLDNHQEKLMNENQQLRDTTLQQQFDDFKDAYTLTRGRQDVYAEINKLRSHLQREGMLSQNQQNNFENLQK